MCVGFLSWKERRPQVAAVCYCAACPRASSRGMMHEKPSLACVVSMRPTPMRSTSALILIDSRRQSPPLHISHLTKTGSKMAPASQAITQRRARQRSSPLAAAARQRTQAAAAATSSARARARATGPRGPLLSLLLVLLLLAAAVTPAASFLLPPSSSPPTTSPPLHRRPTLGSQHHHQRQQRQQQERATATRRYVSERQIPQCKEILIFLGWYACVRMWRGSIDRALVLMSTPSMIRPYTHAHTPKPPNKQNKTPQTRRP